MSRFVFILVSFFLAACGRPAAPVTEIPPAAPPVDMKYGVYPRAIIQAGPNPLWFELTGEGPLLIPSPEEAALNPFSPWPLIRHVQGILAWEERLVLGVNREGFLVLEDRPSGEAGIELYRIDLSPSWGNYSLGAFFFYEQSPAALIYRDDYFIENSFPPPRDRFWTLNSDGAAPLELGAFSAFPSSAGWDLELLRQGPDGLWYFRGLRKGGSQQEGYYGRTTDLSLGGETSGPGALQNAALPRSAGEAPELLGMALRAAAFAELESRGPVYVAAVTAPEFEGIRYFADQSSSAGSMEETRELYAYYHGPMEGGNPRVLVIAPDGKGYYGEYRDGLPRLELIVLPLLPEGFVYTGAGLLGGTILGTWEEQDAWNVGAAGFVLIAPTFSGSNNP
jgi:hypothetical protein